MVRFKSRYLLCEVCVSERSSLQLLGAKNIYKTVRAAVERAHGDYGSAHFNIGVIVKYLNAQTGVVFIRCRKGQYRLIWSALAFITCLETKDYSQRQSVPCFFNCLHVGGTIRTCQKFLVRYNRQQLNRMLLDCKNDAEKQEVRRAILSCSLHAVREEEAYEDWSDYGDDDDDEEM